LRNKQRFRFFYFYFALGYDLCHFYKVGWLQSLAAPFFDLWPSSIKKEPVELSAKQDANPVAPSR